MNIPVRLIVSWLGAVVGVALFVLHDHRTAVFANPSIAVPWVIAYVLRCEIRPAIKRERAPSRRWLIIPVALFALYMVFTLDIVLIGAMFCTVAWMVLDDMSVYRAHRIEKPPRFGL